MQIVIQPSCSGLLSFLTFIQTENNHCCGAQHFFHAQHFFRKLQEAFSPSILYKLHFPQATHDYWHEADRIATLMEKTAKIN